MQENTEAFTLIELLVVVLIIGILAAVAIPQYQVATWKSRTTQAFVFAKVINDAEQAYYLANGNYTSKLEELDIDFSECALNKEKSSENSSLYNCPVGNFEINPAISVYASVKNSDGTQFVQIEYRLKEQRKICASNSNFSVGKKVCLSMGGTLRREDDKFVFYDLPF